MKFRGHNYPAASKNRPHSGSVSWQWATDNRHKPSTTGAAHRVNVPVKIRLLGFVSAQNAELMT